jgi:hypothetical protein
MPFYKTLKFRFALTLSVFILSLCSVSALLSVNAMIATATDVFVKNGSVLVKNVADSISPPDFARVVASLDPEDPYYAKT